MLKRSLALLAVTVATAAGTLGTEGTLGTGQMANSHAQVGLFANPSPITAGSKNFSNKRTISAQIVLLGLLPTERGPWGQVS